MARPEHDFIIKLILEFKIFKAQKTMS